MDKLVAIYIHTYVCICIYVSYIDIYLTISKQLLTLKKHQSLSFLLTMRVWKEHFHAES